MVFQDEFCDAGTVKTDNTPDHAVVFTGDLAQGQQRSSSSCTRDMKKADFGGPRRRPFQNTACAKDMKDLTRLALRQVCHTGDVEPKYFSISG